MRAMPAVRLSALAAALLGAVSVLSAPADDGKGLSAEDKAMVAVIEKEMRQQHEEAVKQAIDEFKKEIRSKSIGDRVNAVKALDAAERDAKIIPELSRLVGDAESVRIAAMEALARYRRDKAAALALAGMIPANSRSASMLARNLDALAGVGHESALPAIVRFVSDKDGRVAAAAIRALGESNSPAAIPLLVEIWEKLEKEKTRGDDQKRIAEDRLKEIGDPLKAALTELTGQKHSAVEDYRAWWTQNRAAHRPKEEAPPPLCGHFDPAGWPGRILPAGCILREVWTGLNGGSLNDLSRDNRMAKPPNQRGWLSRLDAPRDSADNYGTRIRGYVHPPVDGDYTFWIASDDDSELWLSRDDLPGNKALIAKRDGATGWCNWNDKPEQKSKPIRLAAGKRYYLEVLHKEGGGGDHLSVAWQPPGGGQDIIPGSALSPFVAVSEKLEDLVASLGEMPKAGAAPPVPPSPPGAPPAAGGGLVAHWPLDDGPGAAIAAEVTGRAPAGAIRGSPEWMSGVAGKALRFADPDHYVEVPPSSVLNDVNKGSYSLAAWYRPEAVPPGEPDAEHGILIRPGWHGGLSYTSSGRFHAQHWTTGDQDQNCQAPPLPPGAFHHVAMTVDRPAGLLLLYVDGQKVAERRWTGNTEAKDYGSSPWYIGIAAPKHGQYRWAGKGQVDDVRVYSRPLTAEEVKTLYAGAASAAATPLPEKPEKLLRAVNFNGPAVAVDGVPWEAGEGAENCLVGGKPFARTDGLLEPPAEGAKGWMLRSGFTSAGSLPIVLGGVPAGRYKVFLFVWEDDSPVEFGVTIGGKVAVSGRSSGAAGHWEKVGPLAAEAENGALVLRVTGGSVNVSGLEVWKE